MNYYEHHLGDYAEATAHLSFVEDAAYSRMIRKYYAQEKPLPADPKAVQRLVGARSKEEREAVETVLGEFFVLEADGHHNARCDAEIARYQDKQAKAKRSANARWNKHPQHTECNADAMRTHTEGNAHQAPSTRHQTPGLQSAAPTEPVVDVTGGTPLAAMPEIDPITARAIELAGLLRQRGASLTATNPEVRRWAAEGVSDADALKALEIAQQRRSDKGDPSPIPAGYLSPILNDLRLVPAASGANVSPAELRRQKKDKWLDQLLPNHRGATAPPTMKDVDDERTIDAEASRRLG